MAARGRRFADLPTDIHRLIALQLPCLSIDQYASACSRFRRICRAEDFWSAKAMADLGVTLEAFLAAPQQTNRMKYVSLYMQHQSRRESAQEYAAWVKMRELDRRQLELEEQKRVLELEARARSDLFAKDLRKLNLLLRSRFASLLKPGERLPRLHDFEDQSSRVVRSDGRPHPDFGPADRSDYYPTIADMVEERALPLSLRRLGAHFARGGFPGLIQKADIRECDLLRLKFEQYYVQKSHRGALSILLVADELLPQQALKLLRRFGLRTALDIEELFGSDIGGPSGILIDGRAYQFAKTRAEYDSADLGLYREHEHVGVR